MVCSVTALRLGTGITMIYFLSEAEQSDTSSLASDVPELVSDSDEEPMHNWLQERIRWLDTQASPEEESGDEESNEVSRDETDYHAVSFNIIYHIATNKLTISIHNG